MKPLAAGALLALHLTACAGPSYGSLASIVTDAPAAKRPFEPPKLADVQPDPESPFARDRRAELVLGRIGFAASRVRRESDTARRRRDATSATCLDRLYQRLTTLEEKAQSKRADLREAAFERGPAAETAWEDLGRLEAESRQGDCGAASYSFTDDVLVSGSLAGARAVRRAPNLDMSVMAAQISKAPASLRSQSISAAARDARSGPVPPPPAPPPPAVPSAPAAQRDRPHDAALLLRSARLTLAVFEVDKRMDAASAVATELGGYLALRSEREMTVRVPRERFDEALDRLAKLGDVLHKSVVAEDVTDQFVDLTLRLKNAQAVRARLEKLLEQASVRDAVEIHKELAKITDEIERLEGKLKLLRDRIAYSTIALRFEPVEAQRVRTQALLPFPWMRTMGLKPLLEVSR